MVVPLTNCCPIRLIQNLYWKKHIKTSLERFPIEAAMLIWTYDLEIKIAIARRMTEDYKKEKGSHFSAKLKWLIQAMEHWELLWCWKACFWRVQIMQSNSFIDNFIELGYSSLHYKYKLLQLL